MEYEIVNVYDRFYDDQSKQKNAKLLGRFQLIEQVKENEEWSELFIGRNIDTGELCLIEGYEVRYIDSGTAYIVYPLKNICVKE